MYIRMSTIIINKLILINFSLFLQQNKELMFGNQFILKREEILKYISYRIAFMHR